MQEQREFLLNYNLLPQEFQRQVMNFILFLRQRSEQTTNETNSQNKQSSKVKLSQEEFIGMWKDRNDMKDSSEWVRDVRNREWK